MDSTLQPAAHVVPPLPAREDFVRLATWVVIALALAVVCAFLGLVSLAPWIDEFYVINDIHRVGVLGSLEHRLTSWSPRPLSELLFHAYCLINANVQRPLLSFYLVPLWAALAACVLIPCRRNTLLLLAASALLSMFLLGHPVSEVFYWPAGASAYLPTLAGISLLLCLHWGEDFGRSRNALRITALLVAILSSEIGAMFALAYVPSALFLDRDGSSRTRLGVIACWCIAALIVYASFFARPAASASHASLTYIVDRAQKGLPIFLRALPEALLSGDGESGVYGSLWSGTLTKALFFGGVLFAIPEPARENGLRKTTLPVAIGAAVAVVFSLAASVYNFGYACCERQSTMQQCLVYLALAAFATYCARFRSSARPPWAVALFLLCIAVPLLPAWQNVSHDYSQFQLRSAATELTWRSGQASGNSMTLAYVRPGKVVGGVLRTGGFSDESHRVVFEPTPKGQQLNDQILLYFGKSELLISKPMDPTPRRSPGTAVAGADSASGPIERNDSAEVSR